MLWYHSTEKMQRSRSAAMAARRQRLDTQEPQVSRLRTLASCCAMAAWVARVLTSSSSATDVPNTLLTLTSRMDVAGQPTCKHVGQLQSFAVVATNSMFSSRLTSPRSRASLSGMHTSGPWGPVWLVARLR